MADKLADVLDIPTPLELINLVVANKFKLIKILNDLLLDGILCNGVISSSTTTRFELKIPADIGNYSRETIDINVNFVITAWRKKVIKLF